MPELHFKGKEYVYNHHLTVPYRPLVVHSDKSIGDQELDGNLIIQGDNLHALKALLPRYAGKVDCIFIDPPYNTGNENWSYNDNVNSPLMKEWLSSNPVNKEDMLRHDKWLCMMYPRLKLLHELLSEKGSFWMTLDDNEYHHARSILDDIFGEDNFVATVIWHKIYSPKNTALYFSEDHDYILVYSKNKQLWRPQLLERTREMEARFSNPDNDIRGPWKAGDLAARNYYSQGTYEINCPSGRVIKGPPRGMYWRMKEQKFHEYDVDNRIWWGVDKNNVPAIKRFRSEVKEGRVPQTIWHWKDVGHTQDAKKELISIMNFESTQDVFITPKPVSLLARVLQLATDENSIVLDSFAGSASTGHAVLSQNQKDGGGRQFILVECEDYADNLTAERIRRAINGYSFKGTQKEELFREKVTLSNLKKSQELLHKLDGIENLEKHRFDKVDRTVKDGELLMVGKKEIKEKVEAIGGGFTFCTLGAPVDLDKILTGENLPTYGDLGSWLFHTATGEPLDTSSVDEKTWFLGESSQCQVWLIYKPSFEFLKSKEASLTLDLAEEISKKGVSGKRNLVFAPAKYVANKMLLPLGVEYAPLPYSLYRVTKE